MSTKEYELKLRIKLMSATLDARLELFGEQLSTGNQWGLDNRDAIALYLARQHGWTIAYCRSLQDTDLRIALADELKTWQMPKEFEAVDRRFLEFLKPPDE